MERDTSFGRMLRRLRKTRDLTQEALAQQAHCAIDTIKKIESGVRRPSRQLAELFADSLGLAAEERATFLATARGIVQVHSSSALTPAKRHAKLPYQATTFVGRTAELAALKELFAEPAVRLVTIVGPGGMGKTRLAIALAEELLRAERFSDGICFVGLAALDTAEQIIPAIADALGFSLDGKQPGQSSRQQIFDYLSTRRLVLVLDNIEHLISLTGAGNSDATGLVTALLQNAPNLAILATSREHLMLREEQIFLLKGLDLPTTAAQPDASAIALFVQRARQLQPDIEQLIDYTAAARICALVDGMPLAIELAAGWVHMLPLATIAAELEQGLSLLASELRDLPARHRSIRVVIENSFQRLDLGEQAIFARLALFRGGCTLEAIQSITQATFAQIQRLVSMSLVSYDPAKLRYSLHELIRQYAMELLAATPGEPERAGEQHARYYCTFVEQRAIGLSGPTQQAIVAELDSERENIRAACTWAARHARIDLLALVSEGLGYFFEWRGLLDDGEHAFGNAADQLEAQLADVQAKKMLALLRAWQSNFRRLQGNISGAEQLLQQSLALLDASDGDTRAEWAFILFQHGLVESEEHLTEARRSFEESLALCQALDRQWQASHVLLWLGDLARYEGAFEEARRHFRASLAIRTACGDQRGIAEVLIWDSHVAADTGQVDQAEQLARQAVALYKAQGDAANLAFGLGELGVIVMYGGKYAQGYELLQQSLERYQELGNRAMCAYVQSWIAAALLGTGQYGEARSLSQLALTQTHQLPGAQSGLAFVYHYAGWVAITIGVYQEAALLLEESIALHQKTGNAGLLNWPRAQLAYVHWLLGATKQAQAELLEVIRTSIRLHTFLPLVLAIPVVALMLAQQGKRERAAELYALAWQHPVVGNAHCFIDTFGHQLDNVLLSLPPRIVQEATARGQQFDLWQAASIVEQELTALEWD